MKRIALVVAALAVCLSISPVKADVIDVGDIGGLTTFQDTNTGRVWLDMDNFFDEAANNGTSGVDMIAAAIDAGFTFAGLADVQELLNSLPLDGGQWASYAAVMGYGIPRQLIWGMHDDGDGNPYGWAFAYSNMTSWGYANNATNADLVQNAGLEGAVDMGIWAYRSAVVPEPSALALLGFGLLGIAAVRTRRRKD